MAIKISNKVVNLLEARGLIPKHCRLLEISIAANAAMVIRYEIFITDESASIISEAFALIAAEEGAERKGS